jgi:hypothetical protein
MCQREFATVAKFFEKKFELAREPYQALAMVMRICASENLIKNDKFSCLTMAKSAEFF